MQQPNGICNVCKKEKAKYVCPKCKIAYCSVDCYSKHNMDCTESFYSKLVLDEMSLRQKEDQEKDKVKIAQMLKRAQEKIVEPLDLSTTEDLDSVNEYANEIVDSDDEDDFWNSIQEMIDKGENLDISLFPKSIQKEFFEYVKGEEWKKEITVWSPWWLMYEKEHKQIIENCIRPLIIEESSQPTFPSFPCVLWFIHQHQYQDITLPVTLSNTLPYNLLEIVYFYCLCMRVFNGDLEDASKDILLSIYQLSSVLVRNNTFSSIHELVISIVTNEELREFLGKTPSNQESTSKISISSQKSYTLLQNLFCDLLLFLDTPHYIIDALAHLAILYQECIKHIQDKSLKKSLNAAYRKIVFFVSFARKMQTEQFWLLHKELEVAIDITFNSKEEETKSVKKPIIEIYNSESSI